MNKLNKNKLFSILSTFSKVEFNRFKKFVESPYFNSNKDLITLLLSIETAIFKGHDANNFKEDIWKKLYQDKPYDDVRLRKVFSDLLKLLEDYLAQEVYEKNPIHKINYAIQAVGERNLHKLYNSTMNTARRLSDRALYKDGEFYYDQYIIEKKYYDLQNSDLDRSSMTNVEKIINNLDYFYLIEKLRLLCETVNRKNIISAEYKLLFLDEIIEHMQKHSYEEVPAISIHYHMYLTLVSKDGDEHYFKLKALLEKHIDLFPKDQAKEIYTTAINYCLKRANFGNQDFLFEFLNLNEYLLEQNIIAENELSPWRFKNIITAACKLKRFEWAENFINQYKDKITKSYRENAITFNTAQLYFYQKKYTELLPLLLQVEYQDFTYSLSSKLLTVVTYYELDEIEPLLSFIEAFRTYLNRQSKLSVARKKRYLNTLKIVKKLSRLSFSDQKKLAKIKEEALSLKGQISSEAWIFEKIESLEQPTRPSQAH